MINKDNIKNKVSRAINMMPSDGVVLRENINKYNEKVGYNKIAELLGVLYSNESSAITEIILAEKGQLQPKTYKNYMVVYNELSERVQKGDLICIENTFYKINEQGENMKIYCLMKLEEIQGLKIVGNFVLENDSVFEIMEVDYYEHPIKFN